MADESMHITAKDFPIYADNETTVRVPASRSYAAVHRKIEQKIEEYGKAEVTAIGPIAGWQALLASCIACESGKVAMTAHKFQFDTAKEGIVLGVVIVVFRISGTQEEPDAEGTA